MENEIERYIGITDVISNYDELTTIRTLCSAITGSGYPMRAKITEQNFSKNELESMQDITVQDLKRIERLVGLTETDNPAHGQFLTGIIVNFDLTFSIKAWTEAERYKFLDFVSSQSTMHCITKFDLDEQYVSYVDERIIEIMKELVAKFNTTKDPEDYLRILYSNPCGFKLTAKMVTNYRCLRNIYKQRKEHRLPEWRAFCKWIETLPFARELLL